MTGTKSIKIETKMAIEQKLGLFFPEGMFDMERFEDLALATPQRKNYSDIGMGEVNLSVLQYVMANIDWINICLFVNDDFRSCFYDAIMIEKALLQVSRSEYLDFRDDMSLDKDTTGKGGPGDRLVNVDFSIYSMGMDSSIGSLIMPAHSKFIGDGNQEAYFEILDDLRKSPGDGALSRVEYAVYNFIYVLNALQYNGVFRKYVTIVVDNVKKQLS